MGNIYCIELEKRIHCTCYRYMIYFWIDTQSIPIWILYTDVLCVYRYCTWFLLSFASFKIFPLTSVFFYAKFTLIITIITCIICIEISWWILLFTWLIKWMQIITHCRLFGHTCHWHIQVLHLVLIQVAWMRWACICLSWYLTWSTACRRRKPWYALSPAGRSAATPTGSSTSRTISTSRDSCKRWVCSWRPSISVPSIRVCAVSLNVDPQKQNQPPTTLWQKIFQFQFQFIYVSNKTLQINYKHLQQM